MENKFFRIRLFGNFHDNDPNSKVVWDLMTDLRGLRFLPTTFNEVNANKNEVISTPRPAFTSQEGDFFIKIASDVITIEKTNKSANIGQINEFIDNAKNIINKILIIFNKKCNRVGLISKGFLGMEKDKLDSAYLKIVNPISFYASAKPFEWNTRFISRINYRIFDKEESVNILTEIERVRGRSGEFGIPTDFDKIGVSFDINTIPEVTEKRYDSYSIEVFLEEALKTRQEISKQMEDILSS